MKGYEAAKEVDWEPYLSTTPGWLFTLKGGPLDGMEIRLPYSTSTDPQRVVADLPERIERPVWRGDVKIASFTYVRVPVLYTSGKQKGQQRNASAGKGNEVPMFEYVYVSTN